MPDEPPPYKPPPEDLRLLEEAESLRDYIVKTVGFLTRRVQEQVYREPNLFGVRVTVEERKAHAEAIVRHLRDLRAILRAADNGERFEERQLVRLVERFEPRWLEMQWVAANQWRANARPPLPPVSCDVRTHEGATETFYAMAETEFSPATMDTLRRPDLRALVHEAIGIRAEFIPARKAEVTPRTPRWIEPLFEVAAEAKLVEGDPKGVHGWYQGLLKRGVLIRLTRRKENPASNKGKKNAPEKGKNHG